MYIKKFWFGEDVLLTFSNDSIVLETDDGIQFVLYENSINFIEDPTPIIKSTIRILEKLEERGEGIYNVVKLVAEHIQRQLERLAIEELASRL